MTIVISQNEKFDSVAIVEEIIELPIDDIFVDTKKHPFQFKAQYTNRTSPEYNHEILFLGTTKEELLYLAFRKKDSYKYCNGTSVNLKLEDEKEFSDFFFKSEGGISHYAKAGGDMW